MTAFLFYTFVLIFLGILIRIFWVQLLIIGTILYIIAGIVLCSAITAVCFQFFTLMTSQLSDWGSFYTYFMYSLVFFTIAMLVYGCIVYDIVNSVLSFIQNLFKK